MSPLKKDDRENLNITTKPRHMESTGGSAVIGNIDWNAYSFASQDMKEKCA